MSRIRTIKPEFPQSESMGRVTRDARLCFIMLWTLADDEGRLRGNSRMLASLLFPYDEDASKKIEAWLVELHGQQCIRRYRVNGDHYVEIINWLKYQKIDRPTPSKLPPFDDASEIPREDSTSIREPSPPEGKGREGRGGDAARASSRAARPEPLAPTEAHRALAKQLSIDCDAEWAAFNDRIAAKGKAWFTDKGAAFSGWLRQERKYAERDGRVPVAHPEVKRVAM